MVCEACRTKINEPMLMEGCVQGPILSELAAETTNEFSRRRTRIRQQAEEYLREKK